MRVAGVRCECAPNGKVERARLRQPGSKENDPQPSCVKLHFCILGFKVKDSQAQDLGFRVSDLGLRI